MKMAGKYTVRPMDPMGLDVSYGIGCFIITQLAIYKGTYHLLREFETAIECWNMLFESHFKRQAISWMAPIVIFSDDDQGVFNHLSKRIYSV